MPPVEPGVDMVDPGVMVVPGVIVEPGDIVESFMEPVVPVEPGMVELWRVRVAVPRRVRDVRWLMRVEDLPGFADCIWLPEDIVDMLPDDPVDCAMAAAGTIRAAAAIIVIMRIAFLLV